MFGLPGGENLPGEMPLLLGNLGDLFTLYSIISSTSTHLGFLAVAPSGSGTYSVGTVFLARVRLCLGGSGVDVSER